MPAWTSAIGVLDASDAHHEAARRALRAAIDRRDRLALPASAFAEALVGPARSGPAAVAKVREIVERLPIDIISLDADVALAAASLRTRHRSLKLPDALVIATASSLDADELVTTDRRWPPRSRLGLRAVVTKL